MLRFNLLQKRKTRLNFPIAVGLSLLLVGLIALVTAIAYSSSISALVGLGLTFWGIILLYIQTEEYTKSTILDATAKSLLTTLNQTIQELDYKGKAVYLPPKYLNDPDATKAYVPRLRTGSLPPPEQTQKLETQPSQRNTQGMLITPPGAELARLFEKTLGATFTTMNLDNLQQTLPKLLIEDLELATDIEIQQASTTVNRPVDPTISQVEVKHDRIQVRITTGAYAETCKTAQQLPAIYANIGCPLTSAIACAIAKTAGKPTTIETQQTSKDGRTVETDYRILEEEPAWT